MDETAQVDSDILDGSAKEIAAALEELRPSIGIEFLKDLLAREQAGKTRKSVVKLLEEAIGEQ